MINQDILIYVNGEPFVCSSPIKLIEVLSYLDFDTQLVTIEHNAKIVPGQILPTIFLKHCDKVEVVTIVGGG